MVQVARADSLAALGRIPAAIQALRPQAGVDPELRLQLAVLLIRDGRPEAAGRTLAALPSGLSPELCLRAGELYQRVNLPERALPWLRQAAAAMPQDPRPQNLLGHALLALGRYQEALSPLRLAANTDGGNAALHHKLACALRLTQSKTALTEALQQHEYAVSLQENSGLLRYEQAVTLIQLGQLPEARIALEKAEELSPELAEAPRDLELVQRRLGNAVEADLARSRYLRLMGAAAEAGRLLEPRFASHSDDVQIGLDLAAAYRDSFQIPKYVALLQRLQTAQPTQQEVLAARFLAARDAGSASAGLGVLDELQALRPEPAAIRQQRAELLLQSGQIEEAERLVTALRDEEPANAERHFQVGLILARYSQKPDHLARAETAFRQALALMADHPGAELQLGALLLERGAPAEALPRLRRAVDLAPLSREALRLLSQAYQQTGASNHAQEVLAFYRLLQSREMERQRVGLLTRSGGATARAYLQQARYFLRVSDQPQAARALESALRRQPADRETRRQLVGLYALNQRFQRLSEELALLRPKATSP